MARRPKVPLIRHTASPDESLEQPFQGKNRRVTTIEVLPEEIVLEIFDFYRLDAMEHSQGRPWKWIRLTQVCRKWRHVISRSPRRLDLRILCESVAPIGSILASWPTLPLVAKFNAGQKSKRIPRSVTVALRRPDRLCEIDLRVPSSMLAPIVEVIQKPYQALESIRVKVEALTGPSILVQDAFLGGSAPRLREIELDGISFPFSVIRQVLLSTKNLVELHLSNIPNDAYFSPNDLVTALSTLARLKRLTVGFHFPAFPPPSMTRPLPQRTTLPSLVSLDFHGESEYLEEFVARIESPALRKIAIWLFNDTFFEIPQFCRSILHLKTLKTLARAIVKLGVDYINVEFVNVFEESKLSSENWFLGTSCRRLDWQLSFAAQILTQLSFLLSGVHSLEIQSGNELPTGEEDVDSTPWLELFQPFAHVTQVYVWEQLVPSIVRALVTDDMTAEVLPELNLLHLSGYRHIPSVAKAAEQFVAARGLSGRTISLTFDDERQQKRQQQELQLRWQQDPQQQQLQEQERQWQELQQRQRQEQLQQVQEQERQRQLDSQPQQPHGLQLLWEQDPRQQQLQEQEWQWQELQLRWQQDLQEQQQQEWQRQLDPQLQQLQQPHGLRLQWEQDPRQQQLQEQEWQWQELQLRWQQDPQEQQQQQRQGQLDPQPQQPQQPHGLQLQWEQDPRQQQLQEQEWQWQELQLRWQQDPQEQQPQQQQRQLDPQAQQPHGLQLQWEQDPQQQQRQEQEQRLQLQELQRQWREKRDQQQRQLQQPLRALQYQWRLQQPEQQQQQQPQPQPQQTPQRPQHLPHRPSDGTH